MYLPFFFLSLSSFCPLRRIIAADGDSAQVAAAVRSGGEIRGNDTTAAAAAAAAENRRKRGNNDERAGTDDVRSDHSDNDARFAIAPIFNYCDVNACGHKFSGMSTEIKVSFCVSAREKPVTRGFKIGRPLLNRWRPQGDEGGQRFLKLRIVTDAPKHAVLCACSFFDGKLTDLTRSFRKNFEVTADIAIFG